MKRAKESLNLVPRTFLSRSLFGGRRDLAGSTLSAFPDFLLFSTSQMLRTWVVAQRRAAPTVCQTRWLHSSLPASSPAAEASTSKAPDAEAAPKKWTPKSTRTGLIALKRGMTSMWNDQGVKFPVTILQVRPRYCFALPKTQTIALQVADCQVTKNIKVPKPDHTVYHAVQVAAVNKPAKNVTRQMLGHFKGAGVPPKQYVKEFPISSDAHLPVGMRESFSSVPLP